MPGTQTLVTLRVALFNFSEIFHKSLYINTIYKAEIKVKYIQKIADGYREKSYFF